MKFWGNGHFPQLPETTKTTSHSEVWQTVHAPAGSVRFHSNQIYVNSTECLEENDTPKETFAVTLIPNELLFLSIKGSCMNLCMSSSERVLNNVTVVGPLQFQVKKPSFLYWLIFFARSVFVGPNFPN